MKIISTKKYNEWKELEKKYAAEVSANDLLITETSKLMNDLQKKDNNYANLKREMNSLLEVNRDLGDTIEETKKEVKRLKSLLTKNKIAYKKDK